jgi:transcription termination/antitermination protein NusG
VPGVVYLVRNQGEPVVIPPAELANVRRFAAALRHGGLEPEPVPVPYMAEGQWVEVVSGPLQGVRGVVVERRTRRRVLVGLKAIGQGMEIDVDVATLQPIDAP